MLKGEICFLGQEGNGKRGKELGVNARDLPQQVAPVSEGWLGDEVHGIHETCQKAGSAVQKKGMFESRWLWRLHSKEAKVVFVWRADLMCWRVKICGDGFGPCLL